MDFFPAGIVIILESTPAYGFVWSHERSYMLINFTCVLGSVVTLVNEQYSSVTVP